ncbi:MAG: hypothetical protein ACOZAN_01485 [Patescibacteria group bacterium]
MKTQLIAQTLDFTKEAVSQKLPGYQTAADPKKGFAVMFSGVLSLVFTIAALLSFGFMVWGAIEWISAGGDKGKVDKARTRITQSVIGLIALASISAVFILLQDFLDVCVIDFGGTCQPSV